MFRDRRNSTDTLAINQVMAGERNMGRAVIRSLIFNVVLFVTLPLFMLFNMPMLLRRNPPFYFAKQAGFYGLWLAKVICGIDFKIVGHDNIPSGPCIIACKHQSAWDTFALSYIFPQASYVLKKELTKIPIFGRYIKKYDMISIDRKRGLKAIMDLRTQAKSLLGQNRQIIIFPEGSRTAPGDTVTYQKGVLALYKDFDYPVIPVALNSGVCWGRRSWIKWPGVITIQFLPAIKNDLEGDVFMEQLSDSIETASIALIK